MGKRLLLCFTLILGVLFFGNSVSASTDEGSIEYGGWSEDEGYYQNSNEIMEGNESGELTPFSAQGPPHHVSSMDVRYVYGTPQRRVVAKTTWPGNTYHYSQAWFQNRLNGYRINSNRVWGTKSTTARSGWLEASTANSAIYQARTSYGY